MGLINAEPGASALSAVEAKVGVAGVCRRRLGVVMCRVGMVGSVRDAVRWVEQGHVRVGTEVVTDPAFLVTRAMEDFVTWVDTSKVRRTVMEYNDEVSVSGVGTGFGLGADDCVFSSMILICYRGLDYFDLL